jgi:hypothetical protein
MLIGLQPNRTRPPPGRQCYRGDVENDKGIAMAEGVSTSTRTYKHSTPAFRVGDSGLDCLRDLTGNDRPDYEERPQHDL